MTEGGHESRMLIDGKVVDGEAGTFVNINPATEEALGEVADASRADMLRAIDAARRAFDETGLNGTAGYGADTPFGGYKDSGVGRQNGIVGFGQYTEIKSVAYPAQ